MGVREVGATVFDCDQCGTEAVVPGPAIDGPKGWHSFPRDINTDTGPDVNGPYRLCSWACLAAWATDREVEAAAAAEAAENDEEGAMA